MRQTVYITPAGEMLIRHTHNDVQAICETARVLKARYFVTQDGHDVMDDQPIWGVFDLTRCDPRGGGPGVWSLAQPTRTFVADTNDGAVMFAMALGRA